MKILDILNAPWMMSQNYHGDMSQLYMSHMRGDKIDFKAIEKAFIDGKSQRKERLEQLNIVNGIALIDVTGPLTPGFSFFSFFFNGTSMGDIKAQLKIADESPDVDEKLFVMNTPGGTVEGSFELADDIKASDLIKPIRTFSPGMIASAGYLIAASTREILISGKTNQIGSIGVIASKSDWTEFDAKMGVKYDEYVSGVYKNIYSPDRKTDEFVSGAIQETVDYLATLFIDHVFMERPEITKEFLTNLQARLLIGQQAIDGGLVDGISTIEAITNNKRSGVTAIKFEAKMDKTELREKHADLFAEVGSDAVKSAKIGTEDTTAQAVKGERERITKIQSAAFPGQEELITKCINDGLSAGDSSLLFGVAEKEAQKAGGQKAIDDRTESVKVEENKTPEAEAKEDVKDFKALVDAYKKENKCSKAQAITAVAKENPESHKAYIKSFN